jgi:tetratricopeptide (TPR) repeat protein
VVATQLFSSGSQRRSLGDFVGARDDYEQALKIRSKVVSEFPDERKYLTDFVQSLNGLAWVLSTSPIDDLRDGKRAVELATKACELTQFKEPRFLDTLAAAYAESNDFDSAVKWSEKTLELLGDQESKFREQFAQALANYKAKKPMRQGIPPASTNQPHGDQPSTTEADTAPTKKPATEETAPAGPK